MNSPIGSFHLWQIKLEQNKYGIHPNRLDHQMCLLLLCSVSLVVITCREIVDQSGANDQLAALNIYLVTAL